MPRLSTCSLTLACALFVASHGYADSTMGLSGISTTGYVQSTGISVTAADIKANVANALLIEGSSSNSIGLEMANSITGGHAYSIYSSGGGGGTLGSLGIFDQTTSAVRMVINPSGFVGIGTSAPAGPMHIELNAVPLHLRNAGAPAGKFWTIGPDGNSSLIAFNQSNVGVFIGDGGTAWTANSDRRLKKDITPLAESKGLAAITQLEPVTFHWRSVGASSATQTGFIAQDVEKILPELVSFGPSQTVVNDDGTTTHLTDVKGVNYTGIVVPLVQAVKQLKAENDELRHRIEKLEQAAAQRPSS